VTAVFAPDTGAYHVGCDTHRPLPAFILGRSIKREMTARAA
jgi:hypothetical protein